MSVKTCPMCEGKAYFDDVDSSLGFVVCQYCNGSGKEIDLEEEDFEPGSFGEFAARRWKELEPGLRNEIGHYLMESEEE